MIDRIKFFNNSLNHSKTLEFTAFSVYIIIVGVAFGNKISGDASIYFTFFKNFFHLPFSFQSGHVSYGATSPLHVALFAPIHLAAGEHWVFACKAFNFLLVGLGLWWLRLSPGGGIEKRNSLTLAALAMLAPTLYITTAQVYETGITFFLISMYFYFLSQDRVKPAILTAGLFYLARPELILVTFFADGLILLKSFHRENLKSLLLFAALSFLPIIIYHMYMYWGTGEWVPGSIQARSIAAMEMADSWHERIIKLLRLFSARSEGIIYILGLLLLLIAAAQRKLSRFIPEICIILPIFTLYFLFPPANEYIFRYLLPTVPAILIMTLKMTSGTRKPFEFLKCSASCIIIICCIGYAFMTIWAHPRYDYDTLLQKDLAARLNLEASSTDRVLLYEIQGQYYINAHCLSLDGIVGNEMLDVLSDKEPLENFIERNKVSYIVTMNALAYRRIYRNTMLPYLYEHDLNSPPGSEFRSGKLKFTKIFTNPDFADPSGAMLLPFADLNTGDQLRLYGDSKPLWKGEQIRWNSVYKISTL